MLETFIWIVMSMVIGTCLDTDVCGMCQVTSTSTSSVLVMTMGINRIWETGFSFRVNSQY